MSPQRQGRPLRVLWPPRTWTTSLEQPRAGQERGSSHSSLQKATATLSGASGKQVPKGTPTAAAVKLDLHLHRTLSHSSKATLQPPQGIIPNTTQGSGQAWGHRTPPTHARASRSGPRQGTCPPAPSRGPAQPHQLLRFHRDLTACLVQSWGPQDCVSGP